MASTVVSTLYPPLIETFQPAFVYTDQANITFSISPFNEISKIKAIHVSVVDQRNNSNVLQGTVVPDTQQVGDEDISNLYYGITNGILIAEFPHFDITDTEVQTVGLFQYDPNHNLYAINLDPSWLKRTNNSSIPYWNNNQYYQIQIRFDTCTDTAWHTDASAFGQYMLLQRPYFSEWSNITLIKPILEPTLIVTQLEGENPSTYPGNFHLSGGLVFTNSINAQNGISEETELLQSYKIIIQDNRQEDVENIFESDWIYAKKSLLKNETNNIDYIIDLTNIPLNTSVNILIYYKTNNGYINYKNYKLNLSNYNQSFEDVKWNNFSNKKIALMFIDALSKADNRYNDIMSDLSDKKYDDIVGLMTSEEQQRYYDTIEVNQEDGIAKIRFYGTIESSSYGTVYIRRACSKDNFKTWDLIYRRTYTDNSNGIWVNFDDYTICSLYQYKYSAQACMMDSGQEIWGELFISDIIYPKFYEMLLMRQNRQIAIRYNGQVSSWKPTVNRQKIDTLGGRYPKFVENAVMNYKTYQISGLISAEEDFNRKFLSEFEGEYVSIPTDNNEWTFEYQPKYQNDIQKYNDEFNAKYLIKNDTYADGEYGYNPYKTTYPNEYLISQDMRIKSTLFPLDKDNQPAYDNYLMEQHDLYVQDHWYWEREFREELVNWLNDGEPKLYRSMPEGNIAVMLTDINLTPDTQQGRKLYNFSATMYEVEDGYSLEKLNNLGIINIPQLDTIFLSTLDFTKQTSDTNIISNAGISKTGIGQIVISSGTQNVSWINSSVDTNIINTNDYWDSLSIQEQLNRKYAGNKQKYELLNNSISLNNLKIQFTSSPHYYRINDKGKFEININKDNIEESSQWLGYVINIKQSKNSSSEQIFINEKGYYQIPKDISLYGINLNQGDTATLDYIYDYKIQLTPSSAELPTGKEKTIIGQYTNDPLPLNTDIISLIYQNHDKKNYDGGILANHIYLTECYGISLDITPYTYIEYSESNNNISNLTVGETGVFHGLEGWTLQSLKILGRRMTILNNYPYHIEEWQCYQDSAENINHPKINGIYTKNGIQQIYYIDGNWYPIEMINNIVIAKVPIYGAINYQGDLVKKVYTHA